MSNTGPNAPILPPDTVPRSICLSLACSTHLCSLQRLPLICTLVEIRPLEYFSRRGAMKSLTNQDVGTVGTIPVAKVSFIASWATAGIGGRKAATHAAPINAITGIRGVISSPPPWAAYSGYDIVLR